MFIKKSELLLRILDLEMINARFEDQIDILNDKVNKLEKAINRPTKKVNKKG